MTLDHYVSQVHLKNFYSLELGERMYARRKSDLKMFQCDSYSQCRIENGSTNPYLQEPRVIEDFLKEVEPRYNASLEKLRRNELDPAAIFSIVGFAAYVSTCSPAAMRIHAEPLKKTLEVTANILDRQGLIPLSPLILGGKSLTDLLASEEVTMKVDPKYPQSMGIQSILGRVSIWGNSVWDILINHDASNPFFTSDFPMAVELSPDPRILNWIFPLAPNLAIRIRLDITKRGKQDLGFSDLRIKSINATKQDVIAINTAIVQCAESVVYASHDRLWVEGFIRKNQHFRIEPETVTFPTENGGKFLLSTMRIRPTRPAASIPTASA